jgi:hypothetical protein
MTAVPNIPTPEMLCAASAAFWAQCMQVNLQAGVFTPVGREYQTEPMGSQHRRKCYMKATGGGFSELEILDSIHGMLYGRYPQGVLYLFPTSEDVTDYSKTRFGPLTSDNPATIGKFLKDTDSTSVKRVGRSNLFLRGARLSQIMGDGATDKESSKLRAIQVDKCVADEYGLMDPAALIMAEGRMGNSTVKRFAYITNPGSPGDDADELFGKSDQRMWERQCSCGKWMFADLEFPECVHIGDDGRGYIACKKCGKPVPFWSGPGTGRWVPQYRENTEFMEGYHWSHLTSLRTDPADILRKWVDPPAGKRSLVSRVELGKSDCEAEDKLRPEQVRECFSNESMQVGHAGPCAYGADVGKTWHVVFLIRIGKDTYQLLKAARVSSVNDIHDMARQFNTRSAVIDIRPYEDTVRKFQAAEPYKISLCIYTNSPQHNVAWSDVDKTVTAFRTGLLDSTHALFMNKKIVLPRRCEEMEEFVKQVCNPIKTAVEDGTTGQHVYRYFGKNDHYRHALGYALLAAEKMPIVSPYGVRRNRQEKAICEYSMI